jgi:mannosyltransferase OCH1-like enzyme
MINKILLQKSKDKMENYIVNMIKSNLTDEWTYVNYINGEEIKYFNDNPLEEFPDIVDKFNSIIGQPHKADLFRYYYLYINGGVYLDSDAMIHDNIENIIKDFDFVSVLSFHKGTIFNGFIGTSSKHPIIYNALKHLYNINPNTLNLVYFTPGKFLYDLLNQTKYENILLYNEYMNNGIGYTYDKNRMCIIKHYPVTKIIPIINKGETLIPTKVGWTFETLKKFAYFKKK